MLAIISPHRSRWWGGFRRVVRSTWRALTVRRRRREREVVRNTAVTTSPTNAGNFLPAPQRLVRRLLQGCSVHVARAGGGVERSRDTEAETARGTPPSVARGRGWGGVRPAVGGERVVVRAETACCTSGSASNGRAETACCTSGSHNQSTPSTLLSSHTTQQPHQRPRTSPRRTSPGSRETAVRTVTVRRARRDSHRGAGSGGRAPGRSRRTRASDSADSGCRSGGRCRGPC